ncbi:oligosaccharide flippase family protein [Amaricoccus sp. W119]|uniref:oligosaccharide flippase family protein n=1 Tax=Amaricoccus sp. W119 TaxID=3391833 RepID=UPI0039A554B1
MTSIPFAARAERMAPGGEFLSRLLWSFGSFGGSVGLRFLANIVMARLLAPEILGVMVVLQVARFGFELLTDVGIEQNIVRHPDGLAPRFYNTAWTLQILRGTWLSALFLLASGPLAAFYGIETALFAAIALAPFLNGLQSTAIFGLVKALDVKQRTLFELKAEGLGFAVSVTLALIHPSAWALVIGVLVSIAARSAMSYRLPGPRHFLVIDRAHFVEIFRFGRWIMVTSIIMFAAMSLDKIVLAKVAPLAIVGIYGLARTIADIPAQLGQRLTHQLIFPMLAAARTAQDGEALRGIGAARSRLVFIMAAGIGAGIASADWAVAILYDPRYASAGPMLALLLPASFVAVLSSLNAGILLGSNRPQFESAANILRLAILVPCLWLGYLHFGVEGVIAAVLLGELGRYLVIWLGQRAIGLSFGRQDALAILVLLGAAGGLILLRLALGLASPLGLASAG